MAQRTVVELVDDIDGGTAEESVEFGLDGVQYNIDLSAANAERLRAELQNYIDNGTRVGGRKRRGTGATPNAATPNDKAQNQAIRDWARQQGHQISDRGRIPQDLLLRFEAAHS